VSDDYAGFDAFRRKNRFGSLDGLRAASVAAVIWHHTGASFVAHPAAHAGHHGVTLFFAISGFLITTLLLRERERSGTIDLRAFYVRRSLRIFPLYYAVLLLYVVLVAALERNSPAGRDFFANLPYFATYTSNLFVALDGRVIFYFSWSLAAEEQFYLIWPLLLMKLRSAGRALAMIGCVIVALVVLEVVLRPAAALPMAEAALRFVRGVPLAIVAGVAFALMMHERRAFAALWSLLAGSRWHSFGWLLVALGATLWPDTPWAAPHLAGACLVASCVMREDHVLSPVLGSRSFVYVGSISYGLYLLHMLCKGAWVKVLEALGVEGGAATLFFGTFALALVVAGLSWRYFESYFLRLKERFEPARSLPRAAAPSQ
jgi:peptidoglycan/LPS O-acetylase OafA/YrhL